jgi:hypothetical protein
MSYKYPVRTRELKQAIYSSKHLFFSLPLHPGMRAHNYRPHFQNSSHHLILTVDCCIFPRSVCGLLLTATNVKFHNIIWLASDQPFFHFGQMPTLVTFADTIIRPRGSRKKKKYKIALVQHSMRSEPKRGSA